MRQQEPRQIRVETGQKRVRALFAGEYVADSTRKGTSAIYGVKVGDHVAQRALQWYRESPISGIVDHVRLDWDAMDAWFEEDEQVHVHPRDPYTRVDVLQSSRHVRVELEGITVAESRMPRILFETGLVPRFYLPTSTASGGTAPVS